MKVREKGERRLGGLSKACICRVSPAGCDGASAYENVLLRAIVRAAGRIFEAIPQCFYCYPSIFEQATSIVTVIPPASLRETFIPYPSP